jgi:hypothetical protein
VLCSNQSGEANHGDVTTRMWWLVHCTKILRVQLEWKIPAMARHADNVDQYLSSYHGPTPGLLSSSERVPRPGNAHVKPYCA